MVSALTPSWIDEFELGQAGPPDFYYSSAQIDEQAPLQQAHLLRQAWFQIGLSGILCSDGKPVAYIADVADGDVSRIRQLHQAVWSHGVAPLLLAVTPTRVLVFSSLALPTKDETLTNSDGRLVEDLGRVAQIMELRQLVRALQVGTYFDAIARKYDAKKSFDPKHRVDRYLLNNLNVARKQLEDVATDFDRKAVHRLLARVIFACYLIDRRIIGQSYLGQLGVSEATRLEHLLKGDDANAKFLLFGLFRLLQVDFNGDLLEGDLEEEETRIHPSHIQILRKLLNGDDLNTGQLSLAFWAYDFSIIPVETISAIYESFLEADDPTGKKEIGAYYTPRFLCEIVLDEAVGNFPTLLGKRYLDPACGSGVFLVGIFNRLAEEWRRANPISDNMTRFENLKRIVRESLFGIDVSETACRIAAFSLYLAMLDQLDPKDIQQLATPRLPNLVLLPRASLETTEGLNILCTSFFSQNLPSKFHNFDVIVGNPPWARQSQGSMRDWAVAQGQSIPQGQIAAGFVLKTPEHLTEDGRICLLLPAGLLFNHQAQSGNFQSRWLLTSTIQRVINLADLCFYLFENAIRPALCITFSKGKPTANHDIEYLAPKSDPETLRAELLSISFLDVGRISVGSVTRAIRRGQPQLEWKRHMWGTPRDRELLERLDELPRLQRLTGSLSDKGRDWQIGEGFQPLGNHDNPKNAKYLPFAGGDLFVDASSSGLRLILSTHDCTDANKFRGRPLRRLPQKERLFHGPQVLVSYGLKSAYCEFDVYFQHALRGISGPKQDASLLMLLAAILDSDLLRYYFFHTTANWGVERNKVHLEEVLAMPFPLPEDLPDTRLASANSIIQIMREAQSMNQFGQATSKDLIRSRLQPLVADYFDLSSDEQILVTETVNLWEPSSTPGRHSSIPTLKPSNQTDRRNYVQRLIASTNEWTTGSPWRLEGNVIWARGANLSVVELNKVKADGSPSRIGERESWPDLDVALRRAASALRDIQGSMSRIRDLKLFDNDHIYLFKPLQRRFWAESVALIDSDEIIGAILTQRAGSQR